MAKPGTVPNWASDTNFSTSPSAGENGTPTKAAPSGGYLSEGFVPGKNFVSQYVNYVLNLVISWIAYLNLSGTDELTYAAGRTVTKRFLAGRGSIALASFTDPLVFCRVDEATGDLVLLQNSTSTDATWAETLDLPEGVTLTALAASFTPNGVGVCELSLWKRLVDGSGLPVSVTQIGALGSTSTSGSQSVNVGVIAETVTANARYFVVFASNSNGAAQHTARMHCFTPSWTATRATGLY